MVGDRRIEELLRQARAADKVDRERIELFEGMIQTAGWKAFMEILNAKIQMFADQLMVPAGSIDGCVASEFVKGAMGGLVMARDIPAATIAMKDQLRRQPVSEEEFEDDDAA